MWLIARDWRLILSREAPLIAVCVALLCLLSACGSSVTRGAWHSVERGESLSALAQRFGVPIEDLIEINQLTDPSKILVGQRLFIPSARVISSRPTGFISLQGASPRPSPLASEAVEPPAERLKGHPPLRFLKSLQWPLQMKEITVTSPFGPRGARPHKGVDLRAPRGTPSRSVLSGRVTRVAYEEKGYGRYVIIDHGEGLESRYAHHDRNLVAEGDRVETGTPVGEVGSSGRSSGPHLHFELRYRGEALDPLTYLPALP